MKRFLLLVEVLFLLASCTTELDQQINGSRKDQSRQKTVFQASTEGATAPETKVYADENLKVLWNEGDQITIFNKITYNHGFEFDGEDGDTAGGFVQFTETPSTFVTWADLNYVYAVYPYHAKTKINNSGVMTVTLPSEQAFKEHSFGIGANTMVAVADGNFLAFKNVGGYVNLRLYGEDISVRRITIKGNNGEKIAGKASVAIQPGGVPTTKMDASATETITIVCDPVVKIGATASEYTDFWFVIPPVTFEKGFTITLTDELGGTFEKSTAKSYTVNRNQLDWMSAIEVVPNYENRNIQFASESFKAYCVEHFDTNQDGEVSMSEASVVEEIDVCTDDIDSLDGIEYFTNLKRLTCAGSLIGTKSTAGAYAGQLEEINVGQNILLEELDCHGNLIGSIDVSDNPDLNTLICTDNPLVAIKIAEGQVIVTLESPEDTKIVHSWDEVAQEGLVANVVDMGLSVKWASWNMGASKIGDYGELYGMGDPTGLLTSRNSSDYYYGGSSICGTQYDMAHVKWGGNWRLPTREEIDELYNSCSWSETEIEGVKGALVTAPNGATLFLPYSGNRQGNNYYERGQEGHYWTGDPYSTVHSSGYYDIDIKQGRVHQTDGCSNWIGQSIRPVYDDPVENLSANGTANCYLAPLNGYFKFNALVKGNSTESVGIPASVAVVWESFNTSVAPLEGDIVTDVLLEGGYVSFHTGEHAGNALIAVKDADGVILWSWHIWVTDYDPEEEFDIYNGFEGLKVMNRNLGALSKDPGDGSVGLVYEWGRKDPFPGCLMTSKTSFATTSEPQMVTSSETVGTEQYAVQHPFTYIIAKRQGEDWLSVSNDEAWSSSKTIYDPCPAGWRVPDGGENGLWKNLKDVETVSFDSQNYGMTFGQGFSANAVWMPAQGYMSDSNTYSTGWWRVGIEGRYWTVHTYQHWSDYVSFTSGNELFPFQSRWSIDCSRANGNPIRCCKEQ